MNSGKRKNRLWWFHRRLSPFLFTQNFCTCLGAV
nr:MAG TPA: hypothetical protein [Caudoviricetes sp.]